MRKGPQPFLGMVRPGLDPGQKILTTTCFSVSPWFCQISDQSGCVLRALEKKTQPLLLQLRSYLQITSRQCNSLLPSGLRSKHFSLTVAILHSNHTRQLAVCLSSSLHTLLTWLTPPCPSELSLEVTSFKNASLTPILQLSQNG